MKAFVSSSGRVTLALVVIGVVVAACVAGWLARQDHVYARDVASAMKRADQVTDSEFQARMEKMPTFLCEKHAGMPPSAALVRLVHWADDESIAAATRNAAALNSVEPPRRWRDFHEYARQRRDLMVELAVATDAANGRGVELATTHEPTTSIEVITLLANDREYRELAANAARLNGAIMTTESRLRKAAPHHYLRNKAIKRELRRTSRPATLDLGHMYLNATRPRPKAQPASAAPAPTATGVSSSAVPDPAAMPATGAVPGPGATTLSSPPIPAPPSDSGEQCVYGKTVPPTY